ncbi:MAG TPA: hypothetical protein VNA23_01005 [Anaerolineales bacterium]|nr:hypothetical protein [Anaerolineales bacterium]
MNFNFGEILTRAWQIVWKHRVLWIFGILASCGRGGSSFNGTGSSQGDGWFDTPSDLPLQLMQFLQTIEENLTAFIVITVAVVCIIWIITIFLSTIGKIGLIRGTSQLDGGAEGLIFGQLFSESMPYFWRIFGLSFLLGLPVIVVVMVLAAGLAVFAVSASSGSDAGTVGSIALIPILMGCICALIPIMLVIHMITRQAENAIVLENMDVMPALSRGWDIFRKNLGPIVIMAIILAVINFAAGLIITIPIIIVVLPAAIAFAVGEAQNWTPLAIAGVCLCLYIPISLLLNGIAIAYTESAWTLTYRRLTRMQDDERVALPEANE